ncbi:MAG: hypothetical protein SFY81_03400 [Verrucomicrobiota bacterium]|nr:hypothetical protein [Verrucomicrobiota bacterium]
MKLQLFCLCDFASVDPVSSKMNVIGMFDRIYAATTPAIHNLCAVAGKVLFDQEEGGDKKIKITFTAPDGSPFVPALESSLPVNHEEGRSSIQFAVLMSQIKLLTFGQYSIDLEIEGKHVASAILQVMKSAAVPQSQPA